MAGGQGGAHAPARPARSLALLRAGPRRRAGVLGAVPRRLQPEAPPVAPPGRGQGPMGRHRPARGRDRGLALDRPRARARRPGRDRALVPGRVVRQRRLRLGARARRRREGLRPRSRRCGASCGRAACSTSRPTSRILHATCSSIASSTAGRARRAGGEGVFFKHAYGPEEVERLVAELPWQVRSREYAVQRKPGIERWFYAHAPWTYVAGPVPSLRLSGELRDGADRGHRGARGRGRRLPRAREAEVGSGFSPTSLQVVRAPRRT